MKSKFAWFIFWILLLLVSAYGANAQVVIKPETAQYFLEADDERFLLREKDSLRTIEVSGLKSEIYTARTIIAEYQSREFTYAAEEELLITEHNEMVDALEEADRTILKEKRLTRILTGVSAGAVVGSAFGPAGSAGGGLIGGVVGFIVDLRKRKKSE